MKKLFRTTLCAALLTAAVSVSAFAANAPLISPNPTADQKGAFSVLANGEYLTFTDAAPQIKNDRSCLPFRTVFNELGFAEENIVWDGEARTVTATKPDAAYLSFQGEEKVGDVTVKLTIDSNTFSVWYEGDVTADPHGEQAQVVTDYTTEAAPYIDPASSRTYVPLGLVADALGYRVGWDADQRTVIIDDVDAILAANDETYTLMDKYLDYAQSFAEKNQKVTGSYTMNMAMAQESPDLSMALDFLADGDYEMLMADQSAFQFNTDMVLGMDMTLNGMTAEELAAATGEAMPAIPESIDMEMRGDLADGVFYYQSAALAQMLEQPDMANAWFKLDMKALFDQMGAQLGMDYNALMALALNAKDMSFEEYLEATLKAMPATSVDANASGVLAVLNPMLGDSAFKKSGSNYVNSMSAEGMSMSFTLYTSGDEVNGYAMELAATDPEAAGTEMALNASMKDNKMVMEMGMSVMGMVTMTMSMDGTYQATTAEPVSAPPANAVIIDLMALMAQASEG